jgi:hypothetical protein
MVILNLSQNKVISLQNYCCSLPIYVEIIVLYFQQLNELEGSIDVGYL